MAAIEVNPYAIVNATVELDGNTYEAACSVAELARSYTNPTFDGVDGGSRAVADTARNMLNLTFAQDQVTATSLSEYLEDNDGLRKPFKFYPHAGGRGYEGFVIIRAGNAGGTAKQTATANVSMPVDGKPTRIVAAG